MIDKIEPLPNKIPDKIEKKEPRIIREKAKIEDLDKKLEEILNK